jgi:hypothetical protein
LTFVRRTVAGEEACASSSKHLSTLEFDLRKDNDRARSALLHRVALLGVSWGTTVAGANSRGTFRETWTL